MKKEIERLFWDIDKDSLRKKLSEIGAKCVKKEFLQRRYVWSFPFKDGHYSWLRLRDEGDRVVLTFKKTDDKSFAEESETVVSDLEATKTILSAVLGEYNSYQENFREVYMLNSVEVVIDTWPHLLPVCEVESENEDDLLKTSMRLGLNWEESFEKNISSVYKMKFGKYITDLDSDSRKNFIFGTTNPFV